MLKFHQSKLTHDQIDIYLENNNICRGKRRISITFQFTLHIKFTITPIKTDRKHMDSINKNREKTAWTHR